MDFTWELNESMLLCDYYLSLSISLRRKLIYQLESFIRVSDETSARILDAYANLCLVDNKLPILPISNWQVCHNLQRQKITSNLECMLKWLDNCAKIDLKQFDIQIMKMICMQEMWITDHETIIHHLVEQHCYFLSQPAHEKEAPICPFQLNHVST